MSKKINWLITDHNVTVNYKGQTHIVSRTGALADKLIAAIKSNKFDEIPNLVSTAKRVEAFGKGNFTVKDGEIYINGQVVSPVLGNKIVKFSNEGLPYQPLVKFAENLQKNPSFRAVTELFQFLEKNDHPLTENGNFIAYKRVRKDFKDIYSGTFDNSVGQTPTIPRNMVDEDPTRTCSKGLHVANWNYAAKLYSTAPGDIMLEVEVNPADVVAVPVDYDQSKMRVCSYKVLSVMDQEHSTDTSLRVVNKDFSFKDSTADDFSSECIECGADIDEDYDLCTDCDHPNDEDEDEYPYDEELE